MPTISLRLTPDEHAQLEAWAHDGRRSMQKEIIWRLFSGAAVGETAVTGSASHRRDPVRPAPEPLDCPADVPKGVRCKLCGEVHK